MGNSNGPRILTLDIETAPLDVHVWGIWQQDVGLNQIKDDWSILSYSAKWLHEKEVMFVGTGGRGKKKVRDDKALCEKLWRLLDEAEIVVTQNGARFDIPKINARLITHGFGPYSPIRVVDTKQIAKRYFAFTSNRLEFLTSKLTNTKKSTHKKFPGFELWSECLKDNGAAWAEMKTYNQIDVLSTEELFLKLRPWADGPNMGAYSDGEMPQCPKCGSDNLQSSGYRTTNSGRYRRYRCKDCGGTARARANELSPAKRKSLLS
jgi:uncharacterized protein YprB with RNaseH-like and TPR domain